MGRRGGRGGELEDGEGVEGVENGEETEEKRKKREKRSGGIRGDSYILLLPILRVARSNRALIFSTLHSHSTALLLLHL